MREFLQDRIRLVRDLLEDDSPQVAYADVVLILSAVISACAALRWPGPGLDRRRFVELLVSESSADYHLSWISVPALIVGGHVSEADTPYGRPGESTRIFRDEEIDLDYPDALNTYTNVEPRELKRCSYAALIYEWLRCGYAHQYCPHENITSVPPSRYEARLSYIGRGRRDDAVTQIVSFHLGYLIQVAEYHATNSPLVQIQQPNEWWIDAA